MYLSTAAIKWHSTSFMRNLTLHLLSKFTLFPRSGDKGQNNAVVQANATAALIQQHKEPESQREIEAWIIDKLMCYKLNGSGQGKNIFIEYFGFENNCLIIREKTSFPQVDKRKDGTSQMVASLNCITVARINIKSFIKIIDFSALSQQHDNEITFLTEENGIEEERNCSFSMHVLETSRKWETRKSIQKTFTIPFNIGAEKQMIVQLNNAFKKLKALYEKTMS